MTKSKVASEISGISIIWRILTTISIIFLPEENKQKNISQLIKSFFELVDEKEKRPNIIQQKPIVQTQKAF